MMRYNAFYGVPRSQLYEAPDAVEEGEGGGGPYYEASAGVHGG